MNSSVSHHEQDDKENLNRANIDNIDTNKGLIAWFARNSIAANLLMVFILVGGLKS